VNSTFRRESGSEKASALITHAVACTRGIFGDPPELGMVSFVNPEKVQGVRRRGSMIYGYCYLMAGWEHVGYTQGGLWAWQLRPDRMPPAREPSGMQRELVLE